METITQILAQELGQTEAHVQNVIDLLDGGSTIPFIARYRKELHGSMDDTVLRTLEDRLQYLRNLEKRREEVKSAVESQGKLTEELAALTLRLRTPFNVYPDLSDHCLVFFGDSVIGNYTDSASIPGVVAGLTGAAVYNCGYGGNSAALGEERTISLPGIVDAFFQGNLSVLPSDFQVYQGVSS